MSFAVFASGAGSANGTYRLGVAAGSANGTLPANLLVSGSVVTTAVPEPSTLAMAGMAGLIGLVVLRRRRAVPVA